jgi:hypothetical protein
LIVSSASNFEVIFPGESTKIGDECLPPRQKQLDFSKIPEGQTRRSMFDFAAQQERKIL